MKARCCCCVQEGAAKGSPRCCGVVSLWAKADVRGGEAEGEKGLVELLGRSVVDDDGDDVEEEGGGDAGG